MEDIRDVNIAKYISTLLLDDNSVQPLSENNNQMDRKYDFIEDQFEDLIDDCYTDIITTKKSINVEINYLTFTVNGLKYIIPSSQVITVKKLYAYMLDEYSNIFNVQGILGKFGNNSYDKNFYIHLKGEIDYKISVSMINPLVMFTPDDLRLRKSTVKQPWLLGASYDCQYLLLDSYELGCEVLKINNIVDMA